jgi:hypothetical protein
MTDITTTTNSTGYNPGTDLDEVRALTHQMRDAERQVVALGKRRRSVLERLRSNRVPFRVLAQATGTTEHAIYKDLRWGKR